MNTLKISIILIILAVVARVNVKPVSAAEACSTSQKAQLQALVGTIPAHGSSMTAVPTAVTKEVDNIVNSTDYSVGKPLDGKNGWNKSVHLYLPDSEYGKCALLFSVDQWYSVKSWGAEKLGKHAAWGGERVFIPTSAADAKFGYMAFVINSDGGLTEYHWDIKW